MDLEKKIAEAVMDKLIDVDSIASSINIKQILSLVDNQTIADAITEQCIGVVESDIDYEEMFREVMYDNNGELVDLVMKFVSNGLERGLKS